jgi:hypothetical protein
VVDAPPAPFETNKSKPFRRRDKDCKDMRQGLSRMGNSTITICI